MTTTTTSQTAARIEFKAITHSFLQGDSTVDVLDNVSLDIAPGEFVALVGPSGCGKTTLLGMAAGMMTPGDGTARFNGRPPVAGEDVAYMLARDALLPWRSARRNVELALEVRQVPKAERVARADDWLKRVGLESYRSSSVLRLSHGMRQRVAIARTLAQRPRCILMDEPFAALDAQTRIRVQEEFLRLWERERPTVIFVTHDLEEAILLADRVVLMSRGPGRIVADFAVPLPRPRDPERDRSDPDFIAAHQRLWSLLQKQFTEEV